MKTTDVSIDVPTRKMTVLFRDLETGDMFHNNDRTVWVKLSNDVRDTTQEQNTGLAIDLLDGQHGFFYDGTIVTPFTKVKVEAQE